LLVEFLVLVVGATWHEGFLLAASISAGIFVYFHSVVLVFNGLRVANRKDWLQSLSAVSKIPESVLSDMHYP